MAKKLSVKAVPKVKRGDVEEKGKTKNRQKSKKTSIGDSRNSRKIDKNSVRERKGK